MADYPTIQAPNGLKQKIIKNALRKTSSAGYTMGFARSTVAKYEFLLTYKFLTDTERDTLQTFFNANQGLEFTWTHPEDGVTTYNVLFNQDDLEFAWVAYKIWSITFKIIEV